MLTINATKLLLRWHRSGSRSSSGFGTANGWSCFVLGTAGLFRARVDVSNVETDAVLDTLQGLVPLIILAGIDQLRRGIDPADVLSSGATSITTLR